MEERPGIKASRETGSKALLWMACGDVRMTAMGQKNAREDGSGIRRVGYRGGCMPW
jgi:hypothetical protein